MAILSPKEWKPVKLTGGVDAELAQLLDRVDTENDPEIGKGLESGFFIKNGKDYYIHEPISSPAEWAPQADSMENYTIFLNRASLLLKSKPKAHAQVSSLIGEYLCPQDALNCADNNAHLWKPFRVYLSDKWAEKIISFERTLKNSDNGDKATLDGMGYLVPVGDEAYEFYIPLAEADKWQPDVTVCEKYRARINFIKKTLQEIRADYEAAGELQYYSTDYKNLIELVKHLEPYRETCDLILIRSKFDGISAQLEAQKSLTAALQTQLNAKDQRLTNLEYLQSVAPVKVEYDHREAHPDTATFQLIARPEGHSSIILDLDPSAWNFEWNWNTLFKDSESRQEAGRWEIQFKLENGYIYVTHDNDPVTLKSEQLRLIYPIIKDYIAKSDRIPYYTKVLLTHFILQNIKAYIVHSDSANRPIFDYTHLANRVSLDEAALNLPPAGEPLPLGDAATTTIGLAAVDATGNGEAPIVNPDAGTATSTKTDVSDTGNPESVDGGLAESAIGDPSFMSYTPDETDGGQGEPFTIPELE